MNYYITHCDINFLKYAERLFETLLINSEYKILFYTVDFDYIPKNKNIIAKNIDSNKFLNTFCAELNNFEAIKAYNVFLKPYIVQKCLAEYGSTENNFCYLDADCLAIANCDFIFNKIENIIDYPLLNRGCYDFMMVNGRGDPFIGGGFDLNLCLEADLLKKLNLDINIRKQYLQTGVFLFNYKCIDFINSWANLCCDKEIINDWLHLAPFHEETIINCLLWQKLNLQDLNQSLINLPYNTYDYCKSFDKIKQMLFCLESPKDNDYFIDTFCRIPSKENIQNLYFYHGKISDNEYNYIKELMSNNYLLKIHSQSLGDTLAATPTLRKLYNCYNKKIDVMTHHPELFKNNKYVNKLYNFSNTINEKCYKEIFNTFLGVGGEKNKYGVEKKHNTIDIRQFHAIDLGFMLNEKEMEYDYAPDTFLEIKDLPNNYVCLHVANTWPSRTYSDNNWQKLIDLLNEKNIYVVLIGKNSHESGFYNIDKPTKKLNFKLGLDLTNKLDISQCWHVINKSKYFITMDSGLLHLAGTTDTNIIQLGSSINYKLRAPFRNGSQNYKYNYVGGSCDIFCASDIKYGVKEWKTIQGVPPLINCLENKRNFECHPEPQKILNSIILSDSEIASKNKKKFLFIAPHLSTGGSPKYLEWLISQKIKENYDIKVIEWNLYSYTYTVQRESIIKIIGNNNFYSIGPYDENDITFYNKIDELIKIIVDFNPDCIHLNEFSENFAIKPLSDNIIKFLYNKDRKFKLYESTHSAQTNILNKRNIPDELWLVSDYHYNIAKFINTKSVLMEMELPIKTRTNRKEKLKSLGLDPNKMHVLQVGLLCKNKNQKFTFDVAKNFLDSNVEFHFIGNTCYIDECDINKDQSNCKIWGERSDVETFMSCMDLFVMPSFEELNPIALKEALSWDMKCFVTNLPTIYDKYKNNKNVVFLNSNNFNEYIEKNKNNFRSVYEYRINDFDSNEVVCVYAPKPRVIINGNEKCSYNIKFIDQETNTVHYESNIQNNMWSECSVSYYCNWKIIVKNITMNYERVFTLDLKNKNVKIINDSSSLGDSIAWMAIVDLFQKKHECKVDYYTAKKDLFINEYPNINFFNYADVVNKNYYCEYKIGCFSADRTDLCNKDWRALTLQGIACNILGINTKEAKTKIKINNKFKLNFDKYICIATQSTSQSRYWNCENGWFDLINYLQSLGYKIICVDKYYGFGSNDYQNICPKNIDYFAGDHSFDEIIDIINNCEFFIGLSSGLSWLSWALDKKIIRINGSVGAEFEFFTPYSIQNKNVCNSCFNNKNYKFDSSNWSWCPENKNFECTKQIDFNTVKEVVNDLIDSIKKKKKFKIVHLQTTLNTEAEQKSREVLQSFNFNNIKYVLNINEPYEGLDYKYNCLYPSLVSNGPEDKRPDKLTNKHYGCYDSHKKAFINEFNDDIDFLVICEGDVEIEVSKNLFYDTILRIANIMERENIAYFSFGDKTTLETKVLQSNEISNINNQTLCYITDKIIGIQCVMFNKKYKDVFKNSFLNDPWYLADGWYNNTCQKNNLKIGILKNRITSQYNGYSLLDNRIKKFNIS